MATDQTEADRQIYERELKAFLPARILDAHVHLFDRAAIAPGAQFPPACCFHKFGGTFTVEQYREWMAALLPGQEVHLNSFGYPSRDFDLEASAAYTGKAADNRRAFGMAMVAPGDSAEAAAGRVRRNRLVGFKPYPDFVAGKPAAQVTIHDMLPAAQMEAADAMGLAVMLHIPRPGRLADPLNRQQAAELCRRYPRTSIILAHIGRAYYRAGVVGLLDELAACPNAYLDTAMLNHEGVLEYAFRHFPAERLLFGSDAPIAFLRGKSVEINNQYAYLMGEPYDIGTAIHDARRAVAFTWFLYEELRAIRLAAERAGWTRRELEGLLFDNAHRLFRGIAERNYGKG